MKGEKIVTPRPHIAYMQRHERRAPDGSTFRVDFVCGSCGRRVHQAHRFCAWCGKRFWRNQHPFGPKP